MDQVVGPTSLLRALVLASALLCMAGCASPCRLACRHMLEECGIERPGYDVEACDRQCESYLDHYSDEWQTKEAHASVRCVNQAPCEDLQTGTPCYDDAVYIW